ncbi:NUDIX hydrolase [Rickettsiales endosymbiont of Trichoplax sp. H2]|uniref:NUDIX hydrolase n=1 Tax=Rickettsiales endosymbiont of Trichoplax sp. H2 TaxID=2021221 RepID=UPI0012B1B5F7|nr:NUDIX hydrolase [Rickettsiales endosymbiont of Trichoplax sp. H2]MSO13547.1 hypothetical protein [Rickettsiales endosymbiont of Trichoplax sp. H2]
MNISNTKNIEELIKNYKALDLREMVYKDQMLEFIYNSENHFSRSNKLGHFTASAFIMNKNMSKFLLMHHKKLNRWFQLGGHCDGDNDVIRVALKEAREESGINNFHLHFENIFDLDIHIIPKIKDEPSHYHFDCRFLLIAERESMKKNKESNELKWFDIKDTNIPTSNVSIMRMLKKVQLLI